MMGSSHHPSSGAVEALAAAIAPGAFISVAEPGPGFGALLRTAIHSSPACAACQWHRLDDAFVAFVAADTSE
jgi:hypothetical protein